MGVELISEIVQKNNGTFPLVDSNNLRGGIYTVKTIEERDNIPDERRKSGMLCYVSDESEYYKLENNNTWEKAKFGADGIPIYDQEILDEMQGKLPDKYITIPNKESDLNGSPFSREIQQSGTYVDILFSAIRKLQSEVARLRNAFQYGINSYTGENTAMSTILQGIQNPDEEPLWCIEENDLSLIYSLTIGMGFELIPYENVDISTEGILNIKGEVFWEDTDMTIKNVTDPKLFLYLSSNNLNIKLNLISEISENFQIDLSKINVSTIESYNIMVCISRKIKDQGSRFIYISIGNAQRSQILAEGYLNANNQLQQYPFEIKNNYYIKNITLNTLKLSKLNFYSKFQDFSNQVIPSAPTEQDYKYSVAHLTIRSVKSDIILQEVSTQLPNNELIFVENTKKLWIKSNGNLINIGASGSSSTGNGMTQTEVINLLKEMGIVKQDGQDLQINDIADLTFIHSDSGKKFKFKVDSDGNLNSQEVPSRSQLLASRVVSSKVELKKNVRGFIGQLRIAENNNTLGNVEIGVAQDARIYADRVKIGAFYAPFEGDQVHGCSRAFVELENTADCDFSLEGCYLHFTCPNETNTQIVYHLPLTGTLKAGGTYLIVGKQYAQNSDSNVYIKVNSFDQEWFVNNKLIDFTIKKDVPETNGYGFALTYGNEELTHNFYLYKQSDSENLKSLGITSDSKFPRIYDPSFIDAIYYKNLVKDKSGDGYWASIALDIKSNTMYKNMFELDPAKQAFQSCNTSDSSRTRWQSSNDTWIVNLNHPYIQFPHSKDTYYLGNFTPKASFENKNVSTDKSKLDPEKPNMVSCSFGVNIYTTRCFNWISVGYYDEYIWIRKKDTSNWIIIESYKQVSEEGVESQTEYPRRKEFSKNINNNVYARLTGRFPGDNTFYTAHKCVVKIKEFAPTSPETYEYIVGRKDLNGNLDIEHTSSIQTFTLYPESYKPVIYQITDQQGFHWIEYQVWSAAANKILEKIKSDSSSSKHIIPIIINTGDVTQNGTRVNEWIDYYQAGRELFKQYEQMNIVGNNDLCGTDVSILGTGDDVGKSNSYYFHVFNCYDIEESVFKPIVNNKYIPSLYYFDSKDYRFIMINSEITAINCQQWYKLTDGEDIVNIYTGFTVGSEKRYIKTFTPIYTMIYNMLNTAKKCIVACHEMPFTVITNDSISSGQEDKSRSLSNAGALVGSHTNQLSNEDLGKGTYWLSRLLEYKGVKLCLGGHKHTYACTYPVREYFYFNGGTKNSKDNYSEYIMTNTLENDDVEWKHLEKDLTKFPLTKRDDVGSATSGFYPYTPVPDLQNGVTYFMCQATGYKLTSNKELPSANQKFSIVVPKTTNPNNKDKASDDQKYPMFGIIELDNSQYKIKLVRIANIFDNFKFNQTTFSKNQMQLQYLTTVPQHNYGKWQNTEKEMLIL